MTKSAASDNNTQEFGDIAAMPFEAAMSALEQIVARLEKGAVPLEESIKIYERGERLKQHCEALLKQADMRIEKIVLGAGGKPEGVAKLDEDIPF